MKITVIQPDIEWEDKSGNLEKLERMILSSGNDADIVILPEMFSTGFTMKPEKVSEPPRSDTFEWMVSVSVQGNFGLCGSYIILKNNHAYNRWVFVTPEKKSWYYDKHHLYTMGNEHLHYTAGNKQLVFRFRGVRIMATVCYDLRFPVWNRNRNNYDLLINSANWPQPRREVWLTLLRARAIENQCYVAGSNRIGTDGEGIKYCGDSMVVNPRGEVIASAEHGKECCISAVISMGELSRFRKKFPVLNDADKFSILP